MKEICWNLTKSKRLKRMRGVSFEVIKMKLRKMKLTKEEREIEEAIGRKEYVSVSKQEFKEIAHAIEARKKNAVLNIRMNQQDLESIKKKAKRLGVKYQTFIAEVLHRVAMR